MHTSHKLVTTLALALFGLGASQEAQANVFTFAFDTIVAGDTPGGSNVATLTIADSGLNSVLITLDHNATSASGQFITDLFLNLDPFILPTQTGQTPSNKFDGGITAGLNGTGSAGLNFDLGQSFVSSNSNGGANRLKPGESISFTLTGAGLDASDFLSDAIPTDTQRTDIIAMIHLQGIDGNKSVKLGSTDVSTVPEPASMIALSVGGLALLRRRAKK